MQRALEVDGTQWLDFRGDPREQAGREEVYGRYFEDLLLWVFTPVRQETKLEWIQCVVETRKPKTR